MGKRQPAGLRRTTISIRLKLIFAFLLACVPMVFLVGWFGLETATNLMRSQAVRGMRDMARLQARVMEDTLLRGTADARFLSVLEDVGDLAQGCARPAGPPEAVKQHVLGEFVALGESAGPYSTIRYVDASGRERARVDFGPAGASIVQDKDLQDLAGRGYFRPALSLPRGAVFVSPLDLNREQGAIETPHRPVIRFAAPVVVREQALGLVVLSADAAPLLPRAVYQGGHTFLVDPDGYYLSHTDPSKAWSGPRNLNTGHNLRRDLGPDAGLALQPVDSVVAQPGRVLATHPIAFGAPQTGNYIVLGVEATEDLIFAGLQDYRRFFWGFLGVSFIAPVLAGLGLAAYFLQPVRKLRSAVHAVAEGDFDAMLDVRSGDELQTLAEDFNVMAARLREYRQQERMAVIGRLAASIIHDIRNPLSSLTVSAKLVAERDLPDDQRKEVGERMVAQVERVAGMLQEILEFSHTGKSAIEKQPLDLRGLVSDMEYGLQTQCAGRGITFSVDQIADCTIDADREKLQRALSNITLNACEAIQGTGKVAIRSRCDKRGVAIEVTDDGPGIPEDIADRLFEPFVTHGKTHGTGLGLAITQAIVEAHGGRIEAHNRPEGGATFTIWLPADGRPGAAHAAATQS